MIGATNMPASSTKSNEPYECDTFESHRKKCLADCFSQRDNNFVNTESAFSFTHFLLYEKINLIFTLFD